MTVFALIACYAIASGYEWAFQEDSQYPSRSLLASGGEIIPGFSGSCDAQADWEGDSFAILHLVFVIYLFLGIAIICDEQFTSSLESICNARTGLGLTPDVAGATFMAAGSSAPELASSFMGTFVSKSDVGLGTIIGSAVFNILIIIGATAIVVGEPMQLDWKPLGRDVCFYCGSVVLLISFVAGDQQIVWWEALLLLVYYGMYIGFMTINTSVMRMVARVCGDKDAKVPRKSNSVSWSTGTWAPDRSPEKNAPRYETEGEAAAAPAPEAAAPAPEAASAEAQGTGCGTGQGTQVGIIEQQLSPLPGTPTESAVPSMGDAHIVDLSSTPQFGQGAGSGEEVDLPNAPTPTMGTAEPVVAESKPPPEVPAAKEEAEGGGEDEEEEGIADMICAVLSAPFELVFNLTMPDCKYEDPSDEEAEEEIAKLEKEGGHAEEIASLKKQIELRGQIEEAEENEEDDKVKKLQDELFAMYEPLTGSQKMYLVTFSISLVWITILSYFMVVLMEKIGCAWGISSFIMGITFLAMGTSVPDALGSIAVAREGEGDMAVSNAIGSNVFDICIGLGLPWFLVTLLDGKGKSISAAIESIVASTIILFLVVVVLFLSLYCSKHPETGKSFCLYPMVGYILFASYAAFVVFQLVWVGAGLPE